MLSRCDSVTQGLWTPGIVCDVARISRSHTLKGHKCWHKCQWLRWPGDSTKTARWWCSCLRVYGSQRYSIRIFKGRGSKEPGLWKWSKCLGTEKWSHLKSVRLSRWVKARKSRHFLWVHNLYRYFTFGWKKYLRSACFLQSLYERRRAI